MKQSKPSMHLSKQVIIGIQFLFVAFGATVLVPLLEVAFPGRRLQKGLRVNPCCCNSAWDVIADKDMPTPGSRSAPSTP